MRLLHHGGMVLVLGTLLLTTDGTPQAAPPPPPTRTRVALLNLAQTIKGYTRTTDLANENKQRLQAFQEQARLIQTQIELHTRELEKKDLADEKRLELQKGLRAYHRQQEDLGNEARSQLSKKNEEQMLAVYREVVEVAREPGRGARLRSGCSLQ